LLPPRPSTRLSPSPPLSRSRSVDAAPAARRRLAPHPIWAPPAGLGLADPLRAQRAHHAEAIVHLGDVHVRGRGARHIVSGAHGEIGRAHVLTPVTFRSRMPS